MDNWQREHGKAVHNKAELIIAKQRHGPTGTIELFFEAEFTRFADLDQAHSGYDGTDEPPAATARFWKSIWRRSPPTGASLSARHPSGPVAGVVKADGYGLGAAPVAAALHGAGCRHFFVAHLGEALAIRDAGAGRAARRAERPAAGQRGRRYAAHDIAPVLGSLAEVDAWAAAATSRGPRAAGAAACRHRHVPPRPDAGRGRRACSRSPHRLDGIDLRYVMTHLVSAEVPDDPLNEAQRKPLRRRLCRRCRRRRAASPIRPASSSAPACGSDLARPGAALYGVNPTPGQPNPMRVAGPAAGPRACRCATCRRAPPSATTPPGRATRPSRIATVGIGYADGWHRSLSSRGRGVL